MEKMMPYQSREMAFKTDFVPEEGDLSVLKIIFRQDGKVVRQEDVNY